MAYVQVLCMYFELKVKKSDILMRRFFFSDITWNRPLVDHSQNYGGVVTDKRAPVQNTV